MIVKRARAGLLLALGAALAACGGSGDARAPDAISADETRAIAEAAEMLEERQPPPASGEGNE